jgi:RNA polymerase sigma-70 factor (ECF subfamily)
MDARQAETTTQQPHQFTAREYNFVHGVVMRYLRDEQEAADVTQEALLRAFSHQDGFRGDSRFTTWLYRIAATTSLMHLRQRRRARVNVPAEPVESELREDPDHPQASPEDLSVCAETARHCAATLAQMDVRYHEVFRLRFLEGHTDQEVAHRLGIRLATAKTRAYRAREQLRTELARMGAIA